jgi:hypothetical protein
MVGAYEMNTSKERAQSTRTTQPLTREQWLAVRKLFRPRVKAA